MNFGSDNSAAAWLACVQRPGVVQQLEAVYVMVADQVAARGPACWASGRCCNFAKAGHRLYTTGLEAAYCVARLEGLTNATRERGDTAVPDLSPHPETTQYNSSPREGLATAESMAATTHASPRTPSIARDTGDRASLSERGGTRPQPQSVGSESRPTPSLTPATLAAAVARGDCPFLVSQLCGVHTLKPAACRIYFCDQSATQWQNDLAERVHAQIRGLHDLHAIPYRYGEWRELLAMFLDPA